MPPDKQVKALRDVGLEEEANALQKKRAEENMQKNQAEWRKKRLQEINALPLEDQLSVLLEEGFTEEAKELSERLAAAQEEQTGDGSGEVMSSFIDWIRLYLRSSYLVQPLFDIRYRKVVLKLP